MATYVNPLRDASVTSHRIDQGVDYAGTGFYVAIGDCHVTVVAPGGWNPYGNYIEYQLTEPGPLHGMYVYYAEGVQAVVNQGDTLKAGDRVCSLIAGWSSGTEIGWAAGSGYHSWARIYGGGYSEGYMTPAGKQFSDLIVKLGGQPGVTQPMSAGTAPDISFDGITGSGGGGGGGGSGGGGGGGTVGDYDWTSEMVNAWRDWGYHGRRATEHARLIEQSAGVYTYCDTIGAH